MAFLHQSSLSVFAHTNTPKNLTPSIYQALPINKLFSTTVRTTLRSFRIKQSSNPLKACGSTFSNDTLMSIHAEEGNDVKHTNLVQQVRRLIADVNDDRFEDLIMVDALQRLAIDHHFEEEINSILRKRYMQFINTDLFTHLNLYEVALCFRILRQNGFPLSADAFMKFKGMDDNFDAKWNNDVKGLMELYEASQLRIEGEVILDEAQKFSSERLEENLKYLLDDDDQARMVRRTLKNPYHKTIPFFNYKNYINDFKGTVMHELAEMDFNMMQPIHQMELNQISRWWSDLGLGQDLNRARSQPIFSYIGPMTALTNPKLSTERITLAKFCALVYFVDDIFDIYGTTEELTKFAEAIDRWDRNATKQLPSYLQSSFKAIYDVTTEIANEICEQHGFNPINCLRKVWTALCYAFLEEAKWFASGHTLKAEEYLKMGIASSGLRGLFVHLYFLLGEGRNNEEDACIIDDDNNGIVASVSLMSRLFDDLAMTTEDCPHGNDGSYLKCYLDEHESCSVEMAHEHVLSLISDGWKHLNKECLSPNHFSTTFLKAASNFARMTPHLNMYDHADSLALLKDYIKALLLDTTRVLDNVPF